MWRWSVVVVLAAVPATGLAQEFDAHSLQVAAYDGDLRDPLLVRRAGRQRVGEWFAGGVFEYARDLLVSFETDGQGGFTKDPWLTDLFGLNLSVGGSPHERVRYDLAMPLFFTSTGPQGGANGVDVGDLRATATVSILQPDAADQGLGVGAAGFLDLPTGSSNEFLGERSVAGGVAALGTYALDGLTFTADLGVHIRPRTDAGAADAFTAGLGASLIVHPTTSVGLEGRFSVPFAVSQPRVGYQLPVELLVTARHRRPEGYHFLLGAAAAVSPGQGGGSVRAFLGGGFGVIKSGPVDRDGDGIFDDADACPKEPETRNGWEDEDGCPDALSWLDITPTLQGEPLAGVAMSLLESDGLTRHWVSGDGPRHFEGLEPDSIQRVRAVGTCVSGTGEIELLGGENELEVPLLIGRPVTVDLRVLDAEGYPVPGATVVWFHDEPGCAPERTELADGTGVEAVGPGSVVASAAAPGLRIQRQFVDLPPSGEVAMIFTLAPATVAVEDGLVHITRPVLFEVGSDRIDAASADLIDEVAVTLLHYGLTVEVQGHTDDQGDEADNLVLSESRARAVMQALIARGVPAERLSASGYGETRPVRSNDDAAGREANRRVEFHIVDE